LCFNYNCVRQYTSKISKSGPSGPIRGKLQSGRRIFMLFVFIATCNPVFLPFNYHILAMTFEQFQQSLNLSSPPKDLSALLEALWHDANGDWEAAHNIAQSKEGTQSYDRIHAYLHRVEGDTWNAGYWYRRAGSEVFKGTLKEEWTHLAHKFLNEI
jgi:hypothetical protein